jgi:hypothetical protein
MNRLVIRVTRVFLAGLLIVPMQGQNFTLPQGCKLPPALAKTDPFSKCANVGAAVPGKTLTQQKKDEDTAKNTFCADMSSPVAVDFSILQQMQAPAAGKNILQNRDALKAFFPVGGKNIGEGTVVRLMAFVKGAHISDCGQGESGEDVNCSQLGIASNDFHIPLLDPTKPNPTQQAECTSLTAEMSPHFRPAGWNSIDSQTPTMNPVRVTGPLFYDDSHKPCTMVGGQLKGEAPQRISVWEIHPVYSFEVCARTNPSQCQVDSTSTTMWTPYETWVKTHASQTTATGSEQRAACVKASGQTSGAKKSNTKKISGKQAGTGAPK